MLAGSANICPYALSVMDSEALIAVVTHEFIHALGELRTGVHAAVYAPALAHACCSRSHWTFTYAGRVQL